MLNNVFMRVFFEFFPAKSYDFKRFSASEYKRFIATQVREGISGMSENCLVGNYDDRV